MIQSVLDAVARLPQETDAKIKEMLLTTINEQMKSLVESVRLLEGIPNILAQFDAQLKSLAASREMMQVHSEEFRGVAARLTSACEDAIREAADARATEEAFRTQILAKLAETKVVTDDISSWTKWKIPLFAGVIAAILWVLGMIATIPASKTILHHVFDDYIQQNLTPALQKIDKHIVDEERAAARSALKP